MTQPAKQLLPLMPGTTRARSDDVSETLRAAATNDVIIAVAGQAGAGATRVADALTEGLKKQGYDVIAVKPSELIEVAAVRYDYATAAAFDRKDRLARTRALQDAGNALRTKRYPSFVAALVVESILSKREARTETAPLAFVVDSLKNPSEVECLREIYGRSFYLISVVCGRHVRRSRLQLKYKSPSSEALDELMERDESEDSQTGQQVAKTTHLADFFLDNRHVHNQAIDPMADALARFIEALTGKSLVRPNRDETGMYAAWGASLRSACLSRQVGAAITGANGDVIATGTNDVPRFGGGIYEDGGAEDHRCFIHGDAEQLGGYCRNDQSKKKLLGDVIKKLRDVDAVAPGTTDVQLTTALKSTAIADLIEFSRAVHAEMEAIMSLARDGRGSSRGATLYTTTFPCHSCARHIVAAGILDVVYYEPYKKSRALALHGDSIEEGEDIPVDGRKVRFRLFTGIAPRRFYRLFEKRGDLKKDGLYTAPMPPTSHADPIRSLSHLELERKIAEHVRGEVR